MAMQATKASPNRKPVRVTHDGHLKGVLRNRKRVFSLLRDLLPRRIAARLARKLPRRLDGHYVDEQHRQRQSDLVFEVFLKDGPSIIVVIEHKSRPSHKLFAQTYDYYVGILANYGKTLAAGFTGDPVVITLVLYHGKARWNPRVSWHGARAADEKAKVPNYTLDTFRQGFRILFVNLRDYPLTALPGNREVQAGLAAMVSDSAPAFRFIMSRLQEGTRLWRMALTYILHTWDTDAGNLLTALDAAGQTKGETEMGQIAETYRAEGRAEGVARGRAAWLVRLLRRQFKTVPRHVQKRIAGASLEELDAWFDQFPKAPSLDALFGSQR